jgi:hypothetical protein
MTFNEFVNYIRDYDSDTFPARKMSRYRVKQIAHNLLDYFVNNRLDGVLISEALEEIREKATRERRTGNG